MQPLHCHSKHSGCPAALTTSAPGRKCSSTRPPVMPTAWIKSGCSSMTPSIHWVWLAALSTYSTPVTSPSRSEEHTSELQSRGHLVCRLLLEKKKHTTVTHPSPS